MQNPVENNRMLAEARRYGKHMLGIESWGQEQCGVKVLQYQANFDGFEERGRLHGHG